MANVKIYQIEDTRNCPYAFEGFEEAKEAGFNIKDYKMVFECERNITSEDLEELYEEFNNDRPEDFEGHSLSVSDIIELNGDKYYIDHIGFKKI